METILVIDDEQDIREQVSAMLGYEGYHVLTAADGETGVQLARRSRPDVIVSDVLMPGLSGYGVLEALRNDQATATIPFIFLTGLTEREDVRYGMTLGADDFLPKPFDTSDLLAAVRTRLDKHAREEARIRMLRRNLSQALPHELRTPLTGILGMTNFLLDLDRAALPDVDTLFQMFEAIRDSGRRLERLMENYLLYAKLELLAYSAEQRRLATHVAPVSSALILAFAVAELAEKTGRSADVTTQLAEADVAVDEAHLWKIAAELLDNAFAFSAPGTPVRVESRAADGRWTLAVTDHGRGMTAAQIDAVGAYMQFDRQQYEQQGVGLGLTLVSLLAQLYDGDMRIRSIPGRETTVEVTIPASLRQYSQGLNGFQEC